ncbi:MAG: c-type cytochrome [Chloroflexi bacterium]|nr:c-type cytochrome [Chloroflexota bacterium]MCL5274198.1 c-type cytochrome [Chloroflexota bacterium]
MSRRFSLAALTLSLLIAIPRIAFASSHAQAGSVSPLDNPNMLFAVTFGAFLIIVIVLGVVFSLLARFVSKFFSRNVPSDAEMAAFSAEQAAELKAAGATPRKIVITPRSEPFVISAIGFIVVFAITSVVVHPGAPKGEAAAQAPAAAANVLPTTGDFAKIVAGLPKGNPDNGPKLFSSMGCIGCHSQEKDKRLVGPSFYGLWGRAATRKPNYSAAEYIYESIVLPNAYVVDSYPSGVMPQTFAKQLTPQDMADILAWIERDHNEK